MEFLLEANFWNFDHPVDMWGPTQNLAPIDSAVLTFLGHKQTDRKAKYQEHCPYGVS